MANMLYYKEVRGGKKRWIYMHEKRGAHGGKNITVMDDNLTVDQYYMYYKSPSISKKICLCFSLRLFIEIIL